MRRVTRCTGAYAFAFRARTAARRRAASAVSFIIGDKRPLFWIIDCPRRYNKTNALRRDAEYLRRDGGFGADARVCVYVFVHYLSPGQFYHLDYHHYGSTRNVISIVARRRADTVYSRRRRRRESARYAQFYEASFRARVRVDRQSCPPARTCNPSRKRDWIGIKRANKMGLLRASNFFRIRKSRINDRKYPRVQSLFR